MHGPLNVKNLNCYRKYKTFSIIQHVFQVCCITMLPAAASIWHHR